MFFKRFKWAVILLEGFLHFFGLIHHVVLEIAVTRQRHNMSELTIIDIMYCIVNFFTNVFAQVLLDVLIQKLAILDVIKLLFFCVKAWC